MRYLQNSLYGMESQEKSDKKNQNWSTGPIIDMQCNKKIVQKSFERKISFQDFRTILNHKISVILHKALFQHLLPLQMVRAQLQRHGGFQNNPRRTESVFHLHFRTAVPVRRHFQALQC